MTVKQPAGASDGLMDRRRFLKAAAASAATATAAGSGAALLLENSHGPIVSPPPALPQTVETSAAAGESVSELLSRLASLKAENVRLASQLSLAQSQLAATRSGGDAGKTANEALQARLSEVESRAGGLVNQVGVLAGLVALYEQLDEVDLSAAIESGLESVGGLVDELSEQVPLVSEGLATGQMALRQLEEEIPLVEAGWLWLRGQAFQVSILYRAVEVALENATEAVGDFLHLLNDWFQGLLKWLPFGMGDKALATMRAMTGLLAALPDTLDGLDTKVAMPLDSWLEREGDEVRLQGQVIKPVRELALAPAEEMAGRASSLQGAYQESLVRPAAELSERRQAVRQQIGLYRQTYQV